VQASRECWQDIASLDTTQWAVPHCLSPVSPDSLGNKELRRSLLVYCLTALVCFGPLMICALLTMPNLHRPTATLAVPFLRDWNAIFIALVMIPTLITSLLTEKGHISSTLGSLLASRSILLNQTTPKDFWKAWTDRYRMINLWGQVAALVVGAIASVDNYRFFTHNDSLGMWQADGGHMTATGWWFTAFLVPLLFATSVFLAFRAIALLGLLRSLVAVSTVTVKPFHADNAGGLGEVGRIGLRYQVIFAVGGLNVCLAVLVAGTRNPADTPHYALLLCGVLYLVFAPIIFLGPLLPFHRIMIQSKTADMKKIADILHGVYMRFLAHPSDGEASDGDSEMIVRLQSLKALAAHMPSWPIDSSTAHQFIVAYAIPVAAPLLYRLIMLALNSAGVTIAQ